VIKPFTQTFDLNELLKIYPELTPHATEEAVLVPIFHVVAWQIRLQLLHPSSIFRIGTKTTYLSETGEYVVVMDGNVVSVVMRWMNVNKSSFADLTNDERAELPCRGVFPPSAMLMLRELSITGRDEAAVRCVAHLFCHFFVRQVLCQCQLLPVMKNFARELLNDQPYPWFALKPSVAEFYAIVAP